MHKWYIPFLCKVSKGGNPFNYYYSADNKRVLSFPSLRCITRSRRTLPQYREIYRAETFINSVYNIFNMHHALAGLLLSLKYNTSYHQLMKGKVEHTDNLQAK